MTALRELIKTCEFGEIEDEILRDQMVEKRHSRHLKGRLLWRDDLYLTKAVKIARNSENPVNQARPLPGQEVIIGQITFNMCTPRENLYVTGVVERINNFNFVRASNFGCNFVTLLYFLS